MKQPLMCLLRAVSPKTIADFYPISYNSDCYLFSREPIFPLSTEFGEHHRAKRMCEEVGAELVKVADEPENLAILGMSSEGNFQQNHLSRGVCSVFLFQTVISPRSLSWTSRT